MANSISFRVFLVLVLALSLPLVAHSATSVSPKVLFISGAQVPESHVFFQNALHIARAHRLDFSVHRETDDIDFGTAEKGAFSSVVVGDYDAYRDMPAPNRARLDAYCRENKVGMIFLYIESGAALNYGDIQASDHVLVSKQRVTGAANFFRMMKNGGIVEQKADYSRYFKIKNGTYQVLAWTEVNGLDVPNAILDPGEMDQVRRVFLGYGFTYVWYNELLFLDALSWTSPVALPLPLDRWIGIDIDDIFARNDADIKIQEADVEAIIETQQYLSRFFAPDFKFTVGFNMGWYEKNYQPAPYDDAAGDRAFVRNAEKFYWFDHFPEHQPAATQSEAQLRTLMQRSKDWAKTHGVLPYLTRYQLPPHHSGVVPIHEPLYKVWKEIWDTRYTCTVLTGSVFEHEGIIVVPRTDFGLPWNLARWIDMDTSGLFNSVRGGGGFMHVLEHPGTLIMTHQANYARDRIAQKLFIEMTDFITRWTNLRLRSGTNDEIILKSFPPVNTQGAAKSRELSRANSM